MTTGHQQIEAQIDQAFELVAQGANAAAAISFSLARKMAVSIGDVQALTRRIQNNGTLLAGEREQYRAIIAEHREAPNTLVVLADSLGLPRPDDKTGATSGAERTYPMMVLDRLPGHAVQSYCQRYFTTSHVLDLLVEDTSIGANADVVVHVGLNDCANRMFLEEERIAVNLLPEPLKDKIVGFAQKHRRLLIRNLPEYHYVEPGQFRTNLDSTLQLLRDRGARRVVLATIILPPVRFWQATPGLNRNFANYNHMIMDAAARGDALLLDIDRQVWARQHENVLLPDGMHLSAEGHRLFADELAALLS